MLKDRKSTNSSNKTVVNSNTKKKPKKHNNDPVIYKTEAVSIAVLQNDFNNPRKPKQKLIIGEPTFNEIPELKEKFPIVREIKVASEDSISYALIYAFLERIFFNTTFDFIRNDFLRIADDDYDSMIFTKLQKAYKERGYKYLSEIKTMTSCDSLEEVIRKDSSLISVIPLYIK